MDLQNDEEKFRTDLKAAIDSLTPFCLPNSDVSNLVQILQEFCSLLSNLEITDSVDSSIITRIASIQCTFQKYMPIYRQLILNKQSSIYVDPKLAFTLDVNIYSNF
jgi:hypothetical protein